MAKRKKGSDGLKSLGRRVTGPKSAGWLRLSDRYESGCTSQQAPVVLERGEGAHLWDVDGKEYIDWTSGVLVTNVGHCHPRLVAAIQQQAARLMNVYDIPTPPRVTLAQRLVKLMPKHLNRAFSLTTGSETTEAAIRVAKRFTGRNEILSFWGAFHGRTYAAMSVGGKTAGKNRFGTVMPGVLFAPYAYCYRCPLKMTYPGCDMYCIDYIDEVVAAESTGDVAALIVEPYQGAAGFVFPPDGWLKRLEGWAKANDVLFILDEVQASFGRTGKMFAFEWEDLKPHFVCIGKGIGSGATTAALVGEGRIFDALSPGELGSTHGGNPLCSAAGCAVLDIFEEEHLERNALKVGKYMMGRFRKMERTRKHLGQARGRGLVMGLELVRDRKTKEPAPDLTMEAIYRCAARGLLIGRVGIHGNVIRVAPPLVIRPSDAEKSCDVMEKVLRELE